MYHDGYTYFWTEGYDNDASGNGDDASVNLYRISEEEGAAAELLAVFPCPVYLGALQDRRPIQLLAGWGDRIFFFRDEYVGESASPVGHLSWISTDGSTQGEVTDTDAYGYKAYGGPIVYGSHIFLDDLFYEEDGQVSGWTDYDMSSDTLQGAGFGGWLTFVDGYMYYLSRPDGEPVYGANDFEGVCLYRVRPGEGDPEELCPLDGEIAEEIINGFGEVECIGLVDRFLYFTVNNFSEKDGLYALSVSDGSFFRVLERVVSKEPFFNITPERIYYIDRETGAFCACNLDGNGSQMLSPGSEEGRVGRLAFTDRWIYYLFADDTEQGITSVCRVDRNTPHFTHEPIAPPYEWSREYEIRSEGDWIFYVHSRYAEVIDYTGSDSTVIVPEMLGGLPVNAVANSYYTSDGSEKHWSGAKEIYLPSTLKSIRGLHVPGLEKIHIPSGNIIFTSRDFGNDGHYLDVYYDGTIAQWRDVCDQSMVKYDFTVGLGWSLTTAGYTVHCTDGDTDYIGKKY
ncbi:MAG: DUF5050 domain-containing protein [Lachnospiraceae bacterium]|nr:DUF5050 domain-containing protein [Lachnospiraceae bacterium]